ncbi:3-hydroxy-3-methylglutaryl-coenzyme A reductase 1 [Dorcoceras hygrometricum]|uniref:3-hydroxy-3-methylglutaryl-coenzyme A reductase 1 n=1 Tax=Dorcoceras hygrometricum TaxID=472368 RepID=A0A2Z7BQV1_9LAMI|nr:3-hydroxy-3-methylglutaryl-coenzyme A reductase 1 [Dorcoceras hygrometricum]
MLSCIEHADRSSVLTLWNYFHLESSSCYLLRETLVTVHRTISSPIAGGRRLSLEQGEVEDSCPELIVSVARAVLMLVFYYFRELL